MSLATRVWSVVLWTSSILLPISLIRILIVFPAPSLPTTLLIVPYTLIILVLLGTLRGAPAIVPTISVVPVLTSTCGPLPKNLDSPPPLPEHPTHFTILCRSAENPVSLLLSSSVGLTRRIRQLRIKCRSLSPPIPTTLRSDSGLPYLPVLKRSISATIGASSLLPQNFERHLFWSRVPESVLLW